MVQKIDCPICGFREALNIRKVNKICKAYCSRCGYKISIGLDLLNDSSMYEHYKELVKNNCKDLAISTRKYVKFVFAVMTSIRGESENFWDYIPKLPYIVHIVDGCPNCGGKLKAVHNPFDCLYNVECYECSFKTAFHEDLMFELKNSCGFENLFKEYVVFETVIGFKIQ